MRPPRPVDPAPNAARSDSSRNAILDAAERLFSARGFAGTSMRELARAAHTSQALLHHHFGTKTGLYEAVKRRFTERYNVESRPELGAGASEVGVVASTVLGYFGFLRAHPTLVRLSTWARLEGDVKPWGGEDEVWSTMLRWTREAKERGQLRASIDPELLLVLGAAAVGFWFEHRAFVCTMLGLDPDDPGLDDRYARHVIDVLLFGALARDANVADVTKAVRDAETVVTAAESPRGTVREPR